MISGGLEHSEGNRERERLGYATFPGQLGWHFWVLKDEESLAKRRVNPGKEGGDEVGRSQTMQGQGARDERLTDHGRDGAVVQIPSSWARWRRSGSCREEEAKDYSVCRERAVRVWARR